jgi:hypothetical protein
MMRWGMPPPPRAGGYPVTNDLADSEARIATDRVNRYRAMGENGRSWMSRVMQIVHRDRTLEHHRTPPPIVKKIGRCGRLVRSGAQHSKDSMSPEQFVAAPVSEED